MKYIHVSEKDWDSLIKWFEERSGLKNDSMLNYMNEIDKNFKNIRDKLYWFNKIKSSCKFYRKPKKDLWRECIKKEHKNNFNKKSITVCCYDICPLN